jgi:1-deoxy-D-xylulose-5-phosphate reductoisomerase
MSFSEITSLTFEQPDKETFRNLTLAYDAMNKGGNLACILNAANEIMVEAFLKDKIKFLQIAEFNEKCMNAISFVQTPTLEDYINTDMETRKFASSLLS